MDEGLESSTMLRSRLPVSRNGPARRAVRLSDSPSLLLARFQLGVNAWICPDHPLGLAEMVGIQQQTARMLCICICTVCSNVTDASGPLRDRCDASTL